MTDELSKRIRDSEMILFDGTLWKNDEMATSRLEKKLAKEWGI